MPASAIAAKLILINIQGAGILGPFTCLIVVTGNGPYTEGIVSFPVKIACKVIGGSCGADRSDCLVVTEEFHIVALSALNLLPLSRGVTPLQIRRALKLTADTF